MMKKMLLISALALIFVIGGCGAGEENSAQASLPSDYTIISETDIYKGEIFETVLKHNRTDCYYSVTVDKYNWEGSAPTQMFVEKNGVSVPYCD